ncbi:MAG: hypothetical protein A3B74_03050 [Candidatus Kerfeldbacteria bacterium RIFCSPHIGHO2_02_FULL_42_14]|uniref:Peptidase M20 dimerisation domain-containing protein n=1 Tax=Candidatus Kerfeldbacteria bacterium RIFCSPHIGHO2_02_FULL_42_14 TaxID=1798540 RepID=A0A1G2APB0_9BACT|nr:MAG: hypothetical protein A3B74_03050 [Candidatus Kerfeldbacteria bacterium RIFCSPHIGHO2_02_FULL_42_14]OGY82270.1 MAG: hypothetical protein A3E60_00340 [Candidatus Kerfeldbacteria bacterium RIFCSPHIGHO2_12_FULL_42_13]OGY84121.1 MAG: hypothetical protein A3I91_01360 [Candidatus Kerfeldbacteria bacterium RIFCSPLOWO2_02_FULL_42_19]OGY87251.1 MAG: hypothetical protein A3G01_02830 [Candidatus Kerfeldbacteria bacterium RIFCSPLOWO2_12_FULL_43_9]
MSSIERLKKTFLELIAINEVYPHEEEIIRYVTRRLDAAKIPWQLDQFKNIIAKRAGEGEPTMISTHLDIPEPAPNVKYFIDGTRISADGTNILGADPKTGLAVILELLDEIQAENKAYRPIEIVLTRGEERGLLGAAALDYSLVQSKMGLVLDEDGPVTQVVTQAPTFVRIMIDIIGKIVHPREPEKGVNALQVACEALHQIPCGYSTKGVTWNIGIFKSGTAVNSVPGRAELIGEMRSYDTQLVLSEAARVQQVFEDTAKKYGGQCHFQSTFEFEGYKLERKHSLFERLEETFKRMHLTPNYFSTYGGSDANVFNTKGIRCVPLGSGYYHAHEYTESASLKDMDTIKTFLKNFFVVEDRVV